MAGLRPFLVDVAPAGPDDPLSSFARALMEHGAVPILNGKELVGVVHADLVADREHPPLAHARSMSSRPIHVEATLEPADAAAALLTRRVRGIPVLEGNGYTGMVTERSLLDAPGLQDETRPVEEVASLDPITITADATLGHARAVMREERIGRLPVLDPQGALVGILEWPHLIDMEMRRQQRTELSFNEPQPQARLQVTVAMDTAPLVVAPADPVAEVARRMREKHHTAAVLVADGSVHGVVTCEDLLELVATPGETGEGIWVQVTGVEDLDPFDRQQVERHLRESLRRLVNAVRDPETFYLHVKRYHEAGDRTKFSVRARLADAKLTLNARAHGYDLKEVVDTAMSRLERIAREGRDRRRDRARAGSPRYARREHAARE